MDQISARIVADSVNPLGVRITSFITTLPKFLLAEYNTHRMISRNAASSRAIPTGKLIEMVKNNPVLPAKYGRNQSGMQAGEDLEAAEQLKAKWVWVQAARDAADHASALVSTGLHKQHSARPLEPFLPVTILSTATEWKNFFGLRAHPAAMPDLQVLAYRMLGQYLANEPRALGWNEWHMPFGDKMEAGWSDEQKLKVATARCARLSYQTFDGDYSYEQDLRLHDQLVASGHFSPFEHCAQAVDWELMSIRRTTGNFHPSWLQYRKQFDNEHGRNVDLGLVMQNKPDWITL